TAIQLTDGEPYIHGVLKVKLQQTWYPTCSEGFTQDDAYVVCHSHITLEPGVNKYFGWIGVNFLDPDLYSTQYATVCAEGFSQENARVLCNEIGAPNVRIPSVVLSTQSALIYKMNCAGYETDIAQCEFTARPWGYNPYPWYPGECSQYSHYTDYNMRAGVKCSDQRVRLVSDVNDYQGRVEFQYLGVWGTVCFDRFTQNDAKVICSLGGYQGPRSSNITIHNSAKYDSGTGSLIIDELKCKGNESDLDECASYPWTKNATNCQSFERDVGVNCRPETPLRLVGGNKYSGIIEIEYNNTWGTICDKEFDDNDAKVICRMKGFNTESLIVLRNGFYGHGNGSVFISNLKCSGTEPDISECAVGYRTSGEKARWGKPSELCSHVNDVAIQCNTPVRLRDGWTFYSGVVEVFIRGVWQRVCKDNFTIQDSRALCKQAGKIDNYNGSITIHNEQFFNIEFNETHVGGFGCLGPEDDLYECGSGQWVRNTQSCPSRQNVALNCRANTQLRLMNGLKEANYSKLPVNGRVEVQYNRFDNALHKYRDDQWGTICDDQFGDDDALVLCSMKGFDFGKVFKPQMEYDLVGNETITIDDLECLGVETDVSEYPSPQVRDGIKTIKAVLAANNTITYDLKAKNCGGFFVYRLGPTVTKDSGYCFGIGSTVPPPSFVASSIQTVMNHNDTSIWFICKFNHDQNENLVYQVEWHVDGNSEQIVTKQFCNATDITPCHLQHTDMENINVGMGSN
ncbi:hypothetical protein DPMN_024438, partial [Dreissena polymorpha]